MSSNHTATNYSTNATFTNSTGPSPITGPFSPEDIKLIATVFFSLISSLGTIGNFLVILTLVRWLDMRTPCNLFIANISFSDLIVALVMAPLRVIEQHTGGSWIFGEVLCYVIAPLQDTLASASVFTHTAIALERYRAIVAPFKPRLNKRQVKITILFIWVFCYLGTSFPLLFFVKYELHKGVQMCKASQFSKEDRYIFSLYLVVVFILIPLICQICCYILVIRILRRKDAIQNHRESTNTSVQIQIQTSLQRVRAKKRLIRMLIVLMLIFQFCYLPRGFIMMIQQFAPSLTRHVAFPYVNISTMLLFYVKHVINPLILYFMSKDFHDGFVSLCLCHPIQEFSLQAVPGSGKKSTNRTRL